MFGLGLGKLGALTKGGASAPVVSTDNWQLEESTEAWELEEDTSVWLLEEAA